MQEFEPGMQRRQVTTQRTDSFFRVASPNIPRPDVSPAQRLGRSLGILEARATQEIDAFEKRKTEEAEAKARLEFETKGLEGVKEARKAGLYPSNDPYLARALDRYQGWDEANTWAESELNRLLPGSDDPINLDEIADVNSFVRQRLSERVQSLGENKLIHGGFTDASSKALERVLKVYNEAKSQAQVTRAADAVHEQFNDTIDAGLENGTDVKDILQAIRFQFKDISDTMGFKPADIDRILVGVAKVQAERGNHEIVQSLLLDDREGVGSIASKRQFGSLSESILETARNAHKQQFRAEHFEVLLEVQQAVAEGRYTEEMGKLQREQYPNLETDMQILAHVRASNAVRRRQAEARASEGLKLQLAEQYARSEAALDADALEAFEDGTITFGKERVKVLSESGGSKDYTAKQRAERGQRMYNEKSARISIENNETPEQKLTRDIQAYSKSGTVNPEWERPLKSGVSSINVASMSAEALTKNPAFAAGYALYTELRVKAPNLLQRHIDADSNQAQFYEHVRVLQTEGGHSAEAAVQIAFNATKDPQYENSTVGRLNAKAIREAVSNLGEDQGLLFFDKAVDNVGEVGPKVERLAKIYARTMDPTTAIETAVDHVTRTHTIVNGYMIWTGGGVIPEGFGTMAEQYIEDMAGAYGLDPDDLTIQPLSNANKSWRIVYRTTGHPPPELDIDGTGSAFPLSRLQLWTRIRQAAPKARAIVGPELRAREAEEQAVFAQRLADLSANIAAKDLTGQVVGGELEADLQAHTKAAQEAQRKEELDRINQPRIPAGNFLGTPVDNQDDIL